jgi:integrase/recombinase XerD
VASLPLAQAIDEYLHWLELDRHRSPRTVVEYGRDLERFLRFAEGAGATRTSGLDRDLVRAYQRRVSRDRARTPAGPRPHSPATRQRRLVSLRSFLRFASLEEWTSRDLAASIDLPKLPERLPKPLEASDRERLVQSLPSESLPHKRDRALLLLLLSTGARISEVLRLDKTDWGHERLTVVGKGDKERVVNVTQRAREAVDEYLAERYDPSPALFIGFQPASKTDQQTRTANRLTPTGARYVCRQVARSLGIPPFHPHRLRHTLGTLLQEQLGDARLTADTLGHAGLGSVAGYTKITEARRRAARESIEGAGL